MTAPSNANTSGLEVVAWLTTGGDVTRSEAYAKEQSVNDPKNYPSALVTAASAQARIADAEKKAELYDHMKLVAEANGFKSLTEAIARATAAEARADRLAKDTKGLLAEIASFGRSFMTAQESLASTSTPDAYDDAILAASVRYQSMVKTAAALYRAALQQETQP